MAITIHPLNDCTGACETAMGCNCHGYDRTHRYPSQAAADEPLMTQPGDLSERETDPGKSYLPLTFWTLTAAATLVFAGWAFAEIGYFLRRFWP